jgi:hypothetical protein
MDSKNTTDFLVNSTERGRADEVLALAKKQARNERFELLRTEINDLLVQHTEKHNADERLGKVFTLSPEENEIHVQRIDRDGEVTVTFNPSKFTARFRSTTLIALDHTIEVRMNGQNPYLAEGEGRKERTATSDLIIETLVDKAIRSLA